MITDFNKIKDKICCRLINIDRNKEYLRTVPYIEIYDMAVIFYVMISKNDNGYMSYTIKQDLLSYWKISTDVLFELALNNSQRLFKSYIAPLASVLKEIHEKYPEETEIQSKLLDDMQIPLYVCTNTNKEDGACVFLYPDVLKDFAQKINGDVYILPSSKHETLFLPVSEGIDVMTLKIMVQETNACVLTSDEILSDNVYYYSQSRDGISIL